jgi:hypothetical protein
MNNDPLGLNAVSTPEIIRHDRAAPLPEVRHLHNRLMSNECADSLETKVVILAHIIFLAYTDIKDVITK